MMRDYKSMTLLELEEQMQGYPKYRASQLFDWLLKGANSFSEMTNLPDNFKNKLTENGYISSTKIHKKYISNIDGTVKYLYSLSDGNIIEAVLMKYEHGYSICISTQVGCRMGCEFCASTKNGFQRNLTAGEMLSQIWTAARDTGVRISNVVLMGIGEPLDNYDNVLKFLELVSNEKGLSIGMRHISISTCGLVPEINNLAKTGKQITLSISLHAPTDEIRAKIMPIAKKYTIHELLSACKSYIKQTNRRISFEYALIENINDSEDHAEKLSVLLKGMLCHVNLIPVNKIDESGCKTPDMKSVRAFYNILSKNKINTTIRRTLGADINASCGQLRNLGN